MDLEDFKDSHYCDEQTSHMKTAHGKDVYGSRTGNNNNDNFVLSPKTMADRRPQCYG